MTKRVRRVPVLCGGYVHYWIDVSIKDRDWKEYLEYLDRYEIMKSAGVREDKAFYESGLGEFIEGRCSQSRAQRASKELLSGTEELIVFNEDDITDWVFFKNRQWLEGYKSQKIQGGQ